MRAARYHGPTDIRVEEVPVPDIGDDEVLVKVKKSGICGSDLADWYMIPRAPAFFGHEPAGDIAAKGKDVEGFEVGDRVFAHHHVPCMVCHHCIRGHYTMCGLYKRTEIHPGAFAEYIRVPALNLQRDTLKLPDNVTYEEATMIEPFACAVKGLNRLDMHPGDTVAVLGAGFAGAAHVQLARVYGAGKIIAVDGVEYRLKKALDLGADHAVDFTSRDVRESILEVNQGRGADVVVVATSSLQALGQAFEIAGKGATVYLFAPYEPGQTLPVELYRFFFEETLMVATYSSTHFDTRATLNLMSTGQVAAGDLVTHRFGLEEMNQAMALAREARDSLKIVIDMETQ
jgi:L-iditol 2-dehydrogenase